MSRWLLPCVASVWACSPTYPAVAASDVADANDTGALMDAGNEDDRKTLALLATLPSNAPQQIREATVVADAPYQAASGRRCRVVRVTRVQSHDRRERLACSDGNAWFFVPDVFVGSLGE